MTRLIINAQPLDIWNMYSALVGHDTESFLSLFFSASLVLVNVSHIHSFFFLALSLPTLSFSLLAWFALLHSVWSAALSSFLGVGPPLLSPWVSAQRTRQTKGVVWWSCSKWLAAWLFSFCSYYFSPPPVDVSVCLLLRFNSLVTLLSRISRKSWRDVDRQTHKHTHINADFT